MENSHLNSCLEESSQEYVKSLQIPEGICFMVKREPAERDTEVLSRSISAAPYSPHREEKREMVEEEWESLEEPKRWTIVNSLAGGEEEMEWEVSSGLSSIDSKEELNIKVELVPEEQEVLQQEQEEEEEKEQEQESVEELGSSWRGPVSSDNTCSEESDAERAESDSVYTPSCNSSSSSSSSSSWTKTQGGARSHSGVILKLRKVLSNGGEHGNLTLYQAVSDLTDPAVDGRGELQACQEERCQVGDRWRKRVRNRRQGQDRRDKDHERGRDESGDEERRRKRKRRRRERKRRRKRKEQSRSKRRERRERRRERLLRARALSPLDPTSSTTTTTQGSHERKIPKIRYCPYLSTCHSSDRRRRWVLRSAVQSARQAMQRAALPDLVGKRIRHLYEEKDKSEAWYRGVVLRVHEPHPNPLKTVFEVKYDSEPEWRYYLELLVDYQKGWLKVGEDF